LKVIKAIIIIMYEVSRICTSRILKGRHELYVKWKDYNQSHNSWVLLQILLKDFPALLAAYEAKPATFTPRASAPIRATKTKVAQKSVGPAGGQVLRSALLRARVQLLRQARVYFR